MNPLSFLTGFVLLWFSFQPQKEHYVWEHLTSAAGFPGSYNFKLFADGDTIRAFHHQGVWASVDGKTWNKTGLPNIIRNQGFLDYVRFRGGIYALGTFDGNIDHYTQTSQIARTTDFTSWEILAKTSNLPSRFFIHPVVFDNRIWLVGCNRSG